MFLKNKSLLINFRAPVVELRPDIALIFRNYNGIIDLRSCSIDGSTLALTRKILMSGAKSGELVWVRELVKYQVQLKKPLPMFQKS